MPLSTPRERRRAERIVNARMELGASYAGAAEVARAAIAASRAARAALGVGYSDADRDAEFVAHRDGLHLGGR